MVSTPKMQRGNLTALMLYETIIKPILFRQDPEAAHEATMHALGVLSSTAADTLTLIPPYTHTALKTEIAGIEFPNPVMLAAGCDKNAVAIPFWHTCGFGAIEVGTITAQPQSGNPKPRVFRYPTHRAIVNRLGFNSHGSETVAERIRVLRESGIKVPIPVGINIGKTKVVEEPEAVLEDYLTSFRRLSPYSNFMVINVSSPNTPGLRQWQEKERLSALIQRLIAEGAGIPLFLKIAPDLNEADIEEVAEVALESGLAGIIATNTTIAREGEYTGFESPGGLSGYPVQEKALQVLRFLSKHLKGRLPLIGVGGIASAEDAYTRIKAGASLVQIYTALIYEGPSLPRKINGGLLRLMERDGVKHLSEIVGVESR
jgi:dihydroorotate dehydrogenase